MTYFPKTDLRLNFVGLLMFRELVSFWGLILW